MQTPLQVTFRSMAHSEALATHLARRAEQLERLFDRIVSCHVVVEFEGRHHRRGDRYRFSINVGLPGHEILVNHGPPLENSYSAADRAFDDAERQIEDWIRRGRHHRHDAGASQP